MTEQIQKYDVSHQQVLVSIFGQLRLDKHPCMTSACMTSDDINSLNEFDEGEDFVRELNGDLRNVF